MPQTLLRFGCYSDQYMSYIAPIGGEHVGTDGRILVGLVHHPEEGPRVPVYREVIREDDGHITIPEGLVPDWFDPSRMFVHERGMYGEPNWKVELTPFQQRVRDYLDKPA